MESMPWISISNPTPLSQEKASGDEVIIDLNPDSPAPTSGLFADSIIGRVRREASPIYEQLLDAMANDPKNKIRIKQILRKLRDIYAAANQAGRVAGMLTPWAPRLNSEVPLSEQPESLTSISQPRQLFIQWPNVTNALNWLAKVTGNMRDSVGDVATRAQVQSVAFGAEVDDRTMERLNSELEESIRLGEGRDDWRDRAKAIIDTRAGFDETIARTTMHRAYIQGQREILQQPVITDLFPYRQYFATMDNRVRPEHAAMNRKVYHKDSPLASETAALLGDFNCRCSEIPLTEEDALRIGVSSGGEAPASSASASVVDVEEVQV